jgi:hypothetical protein
MFEFLCLCCIGLKIHIICAVLCAFACVFVFCFAFTCFCHACLCLPPSSGFSAHLSVDLSIRCKLVCRLRVGNFRRCAACKYVLRRCILPATLWGPGVLSRTTCAILLRFRLALNPLGASIFTGHPCLGIHNFDLAPDLFEDLFLLERSRLCFCSFDLAHILLGASFLQKQSHLCFRDFGLVPSLFRGFVPFGTILFMLSRF